jgi:hypothetical protein
MRAKLFEEEFKYFKGPSKEKILKQLEKEFLVFKFKKGVENNIPWLVEDCIKEGVDPSLDDDWAIEKATNRKFFNLIEILIKDKRVDPSSNSNNTIFSSLYNNKFNIVRKLFKNEKVRNKLTLNSKQIIKDYVLKNT